MDKLRDAPVTQATASKADGVVQAEANIKAELWAVLVANKVQVWTVAVALFYLTGFLALNAHLTKFGIAEFDIVSTRYVLTAGNFVLFLTFYAMFALRPLLSIHNWITVTRRRVIDPAHYSWFWEPAVMARSLTHPLFMHCFAAAAYTWVVLDRSDSSTFYIFCLSGIFAVTYIMDTAGLTRKYPRVSELLELVADVIGIVVFFASSGSPVMIVFWSFLGLSLYLNFALDMMARRGGGSSMYAFFIANTTVSILTISLAYGAQLYEKVSQKVGGGRPYEVRVLVDEKVLEGMPGIPLKKGELLRTNLIYQTEKYLFLNHGGQTFRLKNEDVRLLAVPDAQSVATIAATPTSRAAPSSPPKAASQSQAPVPAASR